MKKLFTLPLLLVLLFAVATNFSSCSKDKDTEKSLVGDWGISKAMINGKDYSALLFGSKFDLRFAKNKDFTMTTSDETTKGKWKYKSKSSEIIITYDNGKKEKLILVSIDDTRLVINEDTSEGTAEMHFVKK